ncbi:uncharacterized protein A4U43_C03F24780 [Asparagus officinalis]|uniref:Uncharacterized protein n=1 Tax=Asparagus officinalis TaxID=4686 RepID=A0A5P1FHQ8_ASPOF|nr:uncharacterized protein A4U43_C03F24780 [Asparagus officinalis]
MEPEKDEVAPTQTSGVQLHRISKFLMRLLRWRGSRRTWRLSRSLSNGNVLAIPVLELEALRPQLVLSWDEMRPMMIRIVKAHPRYEKVPLKHVFIPEHCMDSTCLVMELRPNQAKFKYPYRISDNLEALKGIKRPRGSLALVTEENEEEQEDEATSGELDDEDK